MNSEKENLQEADGVKKENEQVTGADSEQLNTDSVESKEETTQELNTDSEAVLEDVMEKTEESVEIVNEEVEEKEVEHSEENQTESKEVEEVEDADSESQEIEAKEESEDDEESEEEEEKIPLKNYKELGVEVLIGEAESLLKSYPAYKIKKHFYEIKSAINSRFRNDESAKKEEFIANGGNEIDFYYDNPQKQKFYKVYNDYKHQLDAYNKNKEKEEQDNLKKRLDLIEQLKELYNKSPENNAQLFKEFRELKTKWTNAGKIPRAQSRDVYKTYYHHLDNFYEYLNMNKELREMDYAHNLELRETIIKRTEQLLGEENIQKVLNELQYLHRLWKEEAVPVAEEHREVTWTRFKELTDKIHERKEEFHAQIKGEQQENLKRKEEIIEKISELIALNSENISHGEWQKRIKTFEGLRKQFLAVGRVPREFNNQTWDLFKEKSRAFNKQKNGFYKSLKKDQNVNLEKKLALVEIAKQHQESTNWEDSVREVKRIQREWKNIGHVPRNQSDKIWNEFRNACNTFFDRYKSRNNQMDESFHSNYQEKLKILQELEDAKIPEEKEAALELVNDLNIRWSKIGKIPRGKMEINNQFQNKISEILKALNLTGSEIQEFKMEAIIKQVEETGDEKLLDQQIYKTRRLLEDLEKEYKQLETNIGFFANANEDNPLVSDVYKQIREKKEKILETEILLRKLSSIDFENEEEQEESVEESTDSDEENEA